MPIKKRKKPMTTIAALQRMGEIIAAGYGTKKDAQFYISSVHADNLRRLQSIAAKAEKARNWDFMEGCYKQATELFVLASVLYEKIPEHTILSDGAFDGLAKWLLTKHDKIDAEFWTWYNVTSMGLKAGTGYNLAIREPIIWMVYLLTGTELTETDGTSAQDRPRVLRRGQSKRGSQQAPRKRRTKIKRTVRRRKKLRKSD